jgi:hypothetical protein
MGFVLYTLTILIVGIILGALIGVLTIIFILGYSSGDGKIE